MEFRGKQYSVFLTIGGKWKWSAEIEGQYRSGMAVSHRPASRRRSARSTRRWRRKRNACSVQNERGRQLGRPYSGVGFGLLRQYLRIIKHCSFLNAQRHHAEYDRVVALLFPWLGPQIPSSLM